MYRILSNTLGPSPALAAAGSQNAPHQSLHVPGMGSLTGSSSATSKTAQQQLDSRLSDLLGSGDDWDEEEDHKKEGIVEGEQNRADKRSDTTLLKRGSQTLSELDDMDASLFGSFTQSQRKKDGKKAKPGDSAMPQATASFSTLVGKPESAYQPSSINAATATSQANVSLKPPSNPNPKKQRVSDFDDDILSLLSDEPEEKTSGPRPRPKFQMKPRQKVPEVATSESSSSGHITDVVEGQLEEVTTSGWSEERPKSRRGHPQPPDRLSKSTMAAISSSSSELTQDSLPGNEGGSGMEKTSEAGRVDTGSSEGTKRVEEKRSQVKSRVEFEGGDDLLSGLGLSDGDTSQPKSFHMSQKKSSILQKTEGGNDKNIESKSGRTEDKDEGYMFGGYLPSVVSGTRRVGLPTSEGRRSRPSDASSHSARHEPGTTGSVLHKHQLKLSAPDELKHSPVEGPAKKSVRFSDEAKSETELSNTTATVSHQPKPDSTHKPTTQRVRRESSSAETGTQSPQIKTTPLSEEDDCNKAVEQSVAEERLEHPVFPWQQKKRDRRLLGGDGVITSSSQHKQLREEKTDQNAVTGNVLPSKEAERQSKQEEKERSEEVGISKLPDLEVGLERERTQNNDLKARVALEHQLEASEEQQKSRAKRVRDLEEEKVRLQGGLQDKEVTLAAQLEELRTKLHRVELERDQLQHTLELTKAHHVEEQTTMEKSHSCRIQALEECFHRRETKWKEELESEACRQKEKLEQIERDKTDTVLALRKKVESLEIGKTSEISQLQEIHRSAVADLKREHELDLQRVKDLHRQEVEAIKATHSHTQRLSELSNLVEEATHGVSALQSRVEQSHKEGLEDRQHTNQTHQQHLKTLEERLSKQYRDMESERELLRSLANRLETYLCQQTQAVESEKWSVQQETARLRAGERALEEEKKSSLARLEEERRQLTESKEKFLTEQQKLLSECLREHQSLASERGQLALQQKELAEAEKKDAQRRQAMEMGLEAALAAAKEENVRLATEAARLEVEDSRLKSESFRVKQEREAVERDRVSLQEQRTQVECREEEANKLKQSATALHKEAEEMMLASQRLQAEISEKRETLKTEQEHLDQRENQLASERLAFARECRQLHSKQCSFSHSPVHAPQPIIASSQRLESPHSPSPVLPHSLPQPLKMDTSLGPMYQQQQQQQQHPVGDADTVSSALSSLQQSRQLRNVAWDSEKDDLELQQEKEFLELVHHQNSVLLSNHYRRLHLVDN